MILVQKYGGSSVATTARIFNVANKIKYQVETNKNKLVVVLSAQGDTTDEIILRAREINENADKREMDAILSTGEQQSVALLTIALKKLGVSAISLNSYQVNIITDDCYSDARIKNICNTRILRELEKNDVVVITGFQGITLEGDITTLGRGGSDTSAVAIAASLGTGICEIYTDVDGVYSADPNVVKNTKKLDFISYDEMLEFAANGAKVLQPRSVEIAKKYNVRLVVKSTFNNNLGTEIHSNIEGSFISGITLESAITPVSISNMKNDYESSLNLFDMLMKNNIRMEFIIQSVFDGKKNINFTIDNKNLEQVIKIFSHNIEYLGNPKIEYKEEMSKVSIIGIGLASNTSFLIEVLKLLNDNNVKVDMFSISELKISLLVEQADTVLSMNLIHEKLINGA